MITDENKRDKLPGDLAQGLEQMSALVCDLAEIMGTYYKELVRQGVPSELAWLLVVEYQKTVLTGGRQ